MVHYLDIFQEPVPWKRCGVTCRGKFAHIYDQQTIEKERTRWIIASQYSSEPISTPIHIDVVFHMPIPKGISKAKRKAMLAGDMKHAKKPDTDNLLKYLLDCMTGIIYIDDAQVCSLVAKKLYGEIPRTIVSITPYSINKTRTRTEGLLDDSGE